MSRAAPALMMLLACLGLAGGLTACGDKGDDVQTVPQAETTRTVNLYAARTVTVMGDSRELANPRTNVAPCSGKRGELAGNVYTVQGNYQVFVPEQEHLTTLRRLSDQWRSQGYTITNERTFPDGKGGEVTAINPADRFSITVTSGQPAIAFALIVSSPCYRSTEPI